VQLAQAEGQMARNQALLKNTQRDLERFKILLGRDLISKQEFDAQLAQIDQHEGALKSDQAQIDTAKLQLTYSRITAPISGRIGLRIVDEGNMIQANESNGLAVITQLQPIAVLFSIPQDDLPSVLKRMQSGQKLMVEAYNRDLKQKLATGTLLTIDNQIDPNTGTVRCKAVFPNEDGALFPNQFVNARLLVDTKQSAVIVPAAAIQRSPQSSFVYVVKDDSAVESRNVTIGPGEDETSLSSAVWRRERWSSSRAWTDCSKALRLQPAWPVPARNGDRAPARKGDKKDSKKGDKKGDRNESLDSVHPATSCHLSVDGGHHAGWGRGLLSAAGVGVAASGLPDDPGVDVLSGRQP
jgi:RND family efflux transporter MFP subunit